AVGALRFFQNGGNDVGLVLSSDRCVATVSERKSQNTLIISEGCSGPTVIPVPDQPFGEERRPQVCRLAWRCGPAGVRQSSAGARRCCSPRGVRRSGTCSPLPRPQLRGPPGRGWRG